MKMALGHVSPILREGGGATSPTPYLVKDVWLVYSKVLRGVRLNYDVICSVDAHHRFQSYVLLFVD